MFPTYKNLLEMIDLAMQEKAPQMYARLEAQGTLKDEINERASLALDSYREATSLESKEEVQARQKLPPMEIIAAITMKRKIATEIALSQATEFP